MSAGCTNLKYPNWENVKVESCIHNKPCVSKGIEEKCNQTYGCENWFKKRATLVKANTVVLGRDRAIATYFQCETGLPLHKEHKDVIFEKEEYASYLKSGVNTVTGQAFLTQKGGGVVTCAGESVLMYPDTEYLSQRESDIDNGCQLNNDAHEPDSSIAALYKSSLCDAQGNFEFYKVPAGKYIIKVNVSWDVPSASSIGNYYYTLDNPQGGLLRKKVTVQDGEVNKFIIVELLPSK